MSIWDDIKGAFEDLVDYMKVGYEYVFYGVQTAMDAITYAAEEAWRHTSAAAVTVADAFKEVGITISNAVVEGANFAVATYESGGKNIRDILYPIPPTELEQCNVMTGKAVAAVFTKMAQNGEEYDTFRLLSMACDDKNHAAIRSAAILAANKLGDDLFNIPLVAKTLYKKVALKEYLSWLITRAAYDKPEMMAGGKASQAVAGLVTVAMSTLICEGKIPEGFAWPEPTGDEAQDRPDVTDPNAPAVWAEGSRISIDGAVCLVLDGKVRHVTDMTTYNNLFENWDNIIKASPALQEKGKPMTQGAYLCSANGDPKVYLVNDGVKRHVTSPQVMKKYNFNGRVIKKLSAAEVNAMPTGDPIYHFTKKEGATLKIGPTAVYLLLDKSAHLIPNPATFNQLFANWSRIQEVNPGSVPIGTPLTDGAYLASVDGRVYFVNGGQKRWIMNPIAFNSFNFSWDRIRKLSANDLKNVPEGTPIY